MDAAELRAELERLHADSYGWTLACCARDRAEAEDVLQTVYWKILAGKARYDGRAEFQTWLFSVIRKTAADSWRRKLLQRFWFVQQDDAGAEPVAPVRTEILVEQSEMQLLLEQALRSLPRRQAEVLQLVFYHDLSVQEAAKVMRVSIGSARTHYERGKAGLRQWLMKAKVFDEYRAGRLKTESALS